MADALDISALERLYPARKFSLAHLPSGDTHYQSVGNGPVVILIHGVSGPLLVWDKTVDALTNAGYRVIRYDLFGRGFSARISNAKYDLELYERQLDEVIAELEPSAPVWLVGSSFGAIVSTEYALRYPDKVAGLVLIGPAGFPITVPWTAKVRDIPAIGEWIAKKLSHGVILKQNDHYFVSGRLPDEIRPFVSDQLSVPGTTDAILKTMENAPVQSYVGSYYRLGRTGTPVGVIWGKRDRTFPFENSRILLEAVPQARLVSIEESGHLPQFEKHQETVAALLQFGKVFSK